jgi:hypothetical protein
VQLTESQSQIYCFLYTSNQELKLSPVIDQLKSDPVLSVAPVQRPDLGRVAKPFISREPNITLSPVAVVG